MPIVLNDAIDDPPVFDVCESFAGGQSSFERVNRIEVNQAGELVNLDIVRTGLLTTRRGTAKVGSAAVVAGARVQGMAHYFTPTNHFLVIAINQGLWKWDGATWAAIPGSFSAVDGNVDVSFAQGINVLYFCDGASNLFSWDGTTMTNIGTGTNVLPRVYRVLQWHTNRLFGAGVASEPDAVDVSNLLRGDIWNLTTQSFRVGAGDGEPVVALCPWLDFDLIVLKRNSLWVANTDPSQLVANWSINLIHRRIGCVSQRSVVQVGQDVWFLSDTGVRSVRRTLATTQNEISEAISFPVQDIIDRINWSAAGEAAAVYWQNRYLISLPLDGATDPNYVLVYNTQTKGWSGLWTGWSPVCFCPTTLNGDFRLNMGRNDGLVWQWLDYVLATAETSATFQDDGTDIATRVVTRAMTFTEAVCRKKGLSLEVEFFNCTALADVSVVLDQETTAVLAAGVTTTVGTPVVLPATLPFTLAGTGVKRRTFGMLHLDPYRELQAKIETSAGKIALRQVLAAAFTEALEVEK